MSIESIVPGWNKRDIRHINKEIWNQIQRFDRSNQSNESHTLNISTLVDSKLENGLSLGQASFIWVQHHLESHAHNVAKCRARKKRKLRNEQKEQKELSRLNETSKKKRKQDKEPIYERTVQ